MHSIATRSALRRALLSGLVLISGALANAEPFVAGEHYKVLDVPVQPDNAAGVEVIEVFSYACQHCYAFEPMLESWKARQTSDVAFGRMPAIFNNTYALLAQAFYAAEVLEVTDAIHSPLFEAIHAERRDVRDPAIMASVFEEHSGTAPNTFLQVYNSFGVRGRVQQADAKSRAYGVTGVPSMVVAGKYLIDGKLAGDNTTMLKVVDYLVAQELAATAGDVEGAEQAATDG